MAKGIAPAVVMIVLITLAILAIGGILLTRGPETVVVSGGGVVTEEGEIITADCECTGGKTQSFTLSTYDVDSPGTAISGESYMWRKGTAGWASNQYASAQTGLEECEDYEIVFQNVTATAMYDRSYGPHIKVVNMPCVFNDKLALFQDETYDGLTGTFYNSDKDASAESISAGEVVTVYWKWTAATKQYFGNPYLGVAFMDEPYINDINWDDIMDIDGIEFLAASDVGDHRPEYPNGLCLETNTTSLDDVEWIKAELQDGSIVEMNQISTPKLYRAKQGSLENETTRAYCFEAPVISDVDVWMHVRLDFDDTNAALCDDMNATLWAGNWWIHTRKGTLSWGLEDDDANRVGSSALEDKAADFT